MTELRRTPLFAEHCSLGARLVPFAGFTMPVQYQGIIAEHKAVRERAGLFDISHMGILEIVGVRAVEVTNRLITADLQRVSTGGAVYTCSCNSEGGILDDLLVYRRSADRVLVICNASNAGKMAQHFAKAMSGASEFRDTTDQHVLLSLQGPRALEVLTMARTSMDVPKLLPSFHCADLTVSGINCLVARTGYTGEDGVELLCAAEHGVWLWRALLKAGDRFGLMPVGLGARDTLRLEARLCLYGNEIDETTHPFEAGLGWTVKLDKPEFVGRTALARIRSQPLERVLVAFEVVERNIARHGYRLLDENGRPVGVCTSGAPSPTLGKNIGLGYLPLGMSAVATRFLVDCRGKLARAVVREAPFYRRRSAPN